jgi:hypothetical protein
MPWTIVSDKQPRQLSLLKVKLAICRLNAGDPLPEAVLKEKFFALSRTATEVSFVCPAEAAPAEAHCNTGWRCMRIDGLLPFNLTGILASLLVPLANANVPVFVFSTFDTDYIMVKEEDVEKAIAALAAVGHRVIDEREPPAGLFD